MSGFVLVAVRYRQVTARDELGRPTEWRHIRQGEPFDPVDDVELERLRRAGAILPGDAEPTVRAVSDAASGGSVEVPLPDAPRKTGTTEEWRRYAIALHSATGGARGLTGDEVADLGRNDIIELLGA